MTTDTATVRKEYLQMPRGKFLSTLFMLYGKGAAATLALAAVAGIIAGIAADWRFFVLGLMTVLILAPMVMAFLYIFYGLSPYCCFNTTPHRLHDRGETIEVEYVIEEKEGDETIAAPKPLEIKKTLLGEKLLVEGGLVILLKEKKGFLWLAADYEFEMK